VSKTRAYLPSTLTRLRDVVVSGGIGPPPVLAHAVTDALRKAYPDGGEEDWEYAALTAAAQHSLGLLTQHDPPLRVVITVDVDSVVPVSPDSPLLPTLVELGEVAPARSIASVHVDSDDARDHIAAGRAAWVAAENGDEAASAVVDRCLEHELGWFASQEIGDLLEP